MATGTLLPIPRLGIQVPAGGKLNIYAAGTSTPATTYSDSTLTTPNANPVVADANGLFGPIYVGASTYKLVLTTSAGVTLFSQDIVASMGQIAAQTAINDIVDGRLTLSPGVPVGGGVLAATTIYFSPYRGNRISLYDGTSWSLYNFAELSIALGADTTNKNYDVFAYVSAGAVAIERLVWSSDSARATALSTQDGVLVKSGDTTRRYLGTYRTHLGSTTSDTAAFRYVWNYYNRVTRYMRVTESTDSWTYTTATFRQANGSSANQLGVVIGVAEVTVDVAVQAIASNTTGAVVAVAVGEDATGSATSGCLMQAVTAPNGSALVSVSARYSNIPAAGFHAYAWLEESGASGTTTWYGDNGGLVIQSGISGSVMS